MTHLSPPRSRHPCWLPLQSRHPAGLTLLEVVLALALFSVAAVALVGTINQIGETSMTSQQIGDVEQSLESLIDEFSKVPQLKPLKQDIKAGDDGVAYHIEVQEVKDLKNQEGRFLQNMYRIRVHARWPEGEREAETLRYAGAMLPLN